jgi:hypothetical protein
MRKILSFALCIATLLTLTLTMTACGGTTAPASAQGTYSNGNRHIILFDSTVDFIRVRGANGQDLNLTNGTFSYSNTSVTATFPCGARHSATIDVDAGTITFNGLIYRKGSERNADEIADLYAEVGLVPSGTWNIND